MATITERAVYLAFVERTADVVKKAVQNPDRKFIAIQNRIDKWLHECWAPTRKAQNLNIKAFERRTAKIVGLAKSNPDALTLKAIVTASLLLVEDVIEETPEKKRKGWHWLGVALADLYQLIDPGFGDPRDPEQIAGQMLGEEIKTL